MISDGLLKEYGERYILEPSSDPHKVVYNLEQNRTVSSILQSFVIEKLYKDYSVELWSINRDGFLLNAKYDDRRNLFEIMYTFPSDRIRNRDFYGLLSGESISTIPISAEPIIRIEFFCNAKTKWEVIQPFEKYPRFNFVVTDVYNNDRFETCGVYKEKSPFWFRILDNSNMRAEYFVEYDVVSENFILASANKRVAFVCIFDNGIWKYYVNGVMHSTISQLLDEILL